MKKCTLAKLAVGLLLSLALFTGCGNNGGEAPVEAPMPQIETPATPSPIPPTPQAPAEVEAAPTIDMGGRTIVIGSWNTGMYASTGSPPPDPAHPRFFFHNLMYENRIRVEEQFNVRIEMLEVPWEDMATIITTGVLSGDLVTDLNHIWTTHVMGLINADMVVPINTVALPDSDIMNARTHTQPRIEFDGNIWAFGATMIDDGARGMTVNLDIINAMGAPNPVELFERGEWTWDAMRDVMIAATGDTDGDSVIDTWGLAGQPWTIIMQLLATNNARMVDPNDFTFALDSPNAMQTLEFAYEVFTSDWWMPGDPDDPAPHALAHANEHAFGQGRAALGGNQASYHLESQLNGGLTNNVAFLPFPRGPRGTGATGSSGFTHGLMMPVGVEDPELVIMVMEELHSWPGDEPMLAVEGTFDWLRSFLPTEADVQRLAYHAENTVLDMGFVTSRFSGAILEMVGAWRSGEMTVAQGVETHRQELEDRIEEILRPQ